MHQKFFLPALISPILLFHIQTGWVKTLFKLQTALTFIFHNLQRQTIPEQWLNALNGKIPLKWLSVTLDTFKVQCKKLFL